jgi:hypothetical protein
VGVSASLLRLFFMSEARLADRASRRIAKMLKCAFAIASLVIASGSGVYASDALRCTSIEKAQKAAGRDTTITALNGAQFHFLQGMYVASPTTPDGLPPGDGALILTRDRGEDALILWTRGVLACAPTPIGHAAKLLKMLAAVKAGATSEGEEL